MGITLKPGTYYFGDPSYITKGDEGWHWIEKLWDELYASSDKFISSTIDNVEVLVGLTYGGDGVFGDFFVDSGAIALIDIKYLKDDSRFHYRVNGIKGAKYITLDNDTTFEYNNGVFNLIDILKIDTTF